MIHSENIIQRLEQLLQFYSLSAASFADKIQVQRSSISHLLTGRNKPSLEFILKIIAAFPEVSLDWILLGKGVFPAVNIEKKISEKTLAIPETIPVPPVEEKTKKLSKVVLLYNDGSFESFDQQP